ncbi:MAG TPA: hypothetical protein VJT73_12140 [Polyangiaceae bacterium]|nr:hypothetical protein [Polyangiaceae bacterium]
MAHRAFVPYARLMRRRLFGWFGAATLLAGTLLARTPAIAGPAIRLVPRGENLAPRFGSAEEAGRSAPEVPWGWGPVPGLPRRGGGEAPEDKGRVLGGEAASARSAGLAKVGQDFGQEALGAQPSVKAPRVVWTLISLGAHDKRPELERFLRQVVEKQTRGADWGASSDGPIEATFEVTEFSTSTTKGVVRVTCRAVGHLKGGSPARSHFSMGGRPEGRSELERQLLSMVGRGIVSRLSEMARARTKKSPRNGS